MLLSVVICAYNRARYLPMILDCLRIQSLPSSLFEVLIIDNNSTDDTSQIIHKYISEEPNISIKYFLEISQGVSYARNKGVKEAQGDIIVFLDDDETVENSFLESVYDFFEQYTDAGISSGPVIPVYEGCKPEWMSPFVTRVLTGAYYKGEKIKLLSSKDYPGTGHACFRKKLFNQYGIFNPELGRKGNSLMAAEDKDFFLRLIKGGENCYYLPDAKIFHHIPSSKLTIDYLKKLTFSLGKSERIRTLNLSRKSYYLRLFEELLKWGATFVLWFFYFFKLQSYKGNKLIVFRYFVTKGLITK